MASSQLSLDSVNPPSIDATQIITKWLSTFEATLTEKKYQELDKLFHEDSWWRDTLALSWDLRCPHSPPVIIEYLEANLSANGLFSIAASEHAKWGPMFKEQGPMSWLESTFSFETKVGRGRGVLKLTSAGSGDWKAWTISTVLEELKGHEMKIGARAPRYDTYTTAQTKEEEPTVVVIGAGQSGLSVAAHLQHLGLKVLVVDKAKRVGDSWRSRYGSLRLHTSSYRDHLAFLEFPKDWPTFASKDRIADFLEHYASLLNLNVLQETETLATSSSGGKERVLHPKHVILATGIMSSQPIIPTFPDQEKFDGELYHSGKHKDASKVPDIESKKIVIVGSGTSAHDIAQDFVTCGARDVTMIQRGPEYVFSADFVLKAFFVPLEEGLTPEEDSFRSKAVPNLLLSEFADRVSAMAAAADRELQEGLAKTEYALNKGEDGSNIMRCILGRSAGFYFDVGACSMISDGRIKLRRCSEGIKHFTADGLVLADGRKVEADTVILATGWKMIGDTIGDVMGEEVARRCGPVWGLDKEGELRSVWRSSGHPAFWVMAGNFEFIRARCKDLALQIKAVELGLNPQHYRCEQP